MQTTKRKLDPQPCFINAMIHKQEMLYTHGASKLHRLSHTFKEFEDFVWRNTD